MKIKFSLFSALLFLLISCQQTENAEDTRVATTTFNEAAETDSIMKTIEKETLCFFQRDLDCWKQYYAQTDYAFQGWSNGDGSIDAHVGWTEILGEVEKFMQKYPAPPEGSSHPKVERRKMKVKFLGENYAYLMWDQYNSDPKQSEYTLSKETRIMEKIDGKWKIVNVTAFWDYNTKMPIDSLK